MLGAAGVLLRLWWFAVPYYIGCILAWICGSYVGALKGEFAPTAGAITAGFFIAVFALFGVVLQWRSLRKKRLRLKEEKARAQLKTEKASQRGALQICVATYMWADLLLFIVTCQEAHDITSLRCHHLS